MIPGKFNSKFGARLLLLLLPVLAGSCKKDWLDAKTNKNLAVPSTLSDFQQLMDNTDVMNSNSAGLGEIGSDGHSAISDFWQYESSQEHNAYTWSHDKPNIISMDWNAPYSRVAYCNVVLEGLAGITPGNNAEQLTWNAIRGNALFQRARSFFELAQVFAPPYNVAGMPGNWGIPLRLVSDVNIPSSRSTVTATYNQVINDLLAAKDLLPVTVPYKTRASKPAAFALLARVYLAMEVYDKAFHYADSCLRLTNALLDYKNLKSQETYPLHKFNSEVIFHSTLVNWGNIVGDAILDSALYVLYDSNDLRRMLFFKPNFYGMQFRGSYNGAAIQFSGLAVDEMYLTRAECSARMHNITAAMNDLDTLLAYRTAPGYILPSATDETDALKKVMRERAKELLFRGLRWPDLRRLNNDPAFAVVITRSVNGLSYTLSPNSFRYTFPIPDDIIQMSGMAQNPGW